MSEKLRADALAMPMWSTKMMALKLEPTLRNGPLGVGD